MADDSAALTAMKGIWMTGGSAVNAAPSDWRAALDGASPAEAELWLVAIAGQALRVRFRPAAPPGLKPRPPLPALAAEVLPDALRPLFRRAMAQAPTAEMKTGLLWLLAARGYAAHPADWMPASDGGGAPDIYAPWRDWIAGIGTDAADAETALTEESWDLFRPAKRRQLLQALRKQDPDRARALIAAKAASEPADGRAALIEILAFNLSDSDVGYLDELRGDRSGKVRDAAARLAARIGGAEAGDVERELAGFLKWGKPGLLRRHPYFAPAALKNRAQSNRRHEIFELASLDGLAKALGIDAADILAHWSFAEYADADADFVDMVARTGGDAAASALHERIVRSPRIPVALLGRLADRVDGTARRRAVSASLDRANDQFESAVICAGPDLGWVPPEKIVYAPMLRELKHTVHEASHEADMSNRQNLDGFAAALALRVALLASRDAATEVLSDLGRSGMSADNPSMSALRLNAALQPLQKEP